MLETVIGSDRDDRHDAEIRAHLKAITSAVDRKRFVANLMAEGDLSAARAVLSAPAYLAGIDDQGLAEIRDDATKACDPERFETVVVLRQGKESAEKALAAAIRAIEEQLNAPLPGVDRPVPSVPLPLPSPEEQAHITRAFERAVAMQDDGSPQAALDA
jgi:hypothetical protein